MRISAKYELPFETKCPACGNDQAHLVEDNGAEAYNLTLLCTKPVPDGEDDANEMTADEARAAGHLKPGQVHICGMQWDPHTSPEGEVYYDEEREAREDDARDS